MSWKTHSVQDQKLLLIADWLRGDEPKESLCARYGISRETGYQWWRRYQAEGLPGLAERSRAPHEHGRAMSAEAAVKLIELRKLKPYWGPKKLLAILRERAPKLVLPSSSAVSDLFRREGLIEPRRRRRRALSNDQLFGEVGAPNDSWCIDFKGWFRTGDGLRCDPFTTTDAHSRFLLELKIVEPKGYAVEAAMDALFERHGLPRAIRSDKGSPFASIGAGGLTRTSARWAKLGIRLERIEPGKPQQNGRHERMHGTLKGQACKPPSADVASQQARFDAFRAEFNTERPHEALGQIPPCRVYCDSTRPMPRHIEEPVYDDSEDLRRVRSNGEIRWQGGLLFVSEALTGETVAIRELEEGHHLIRVADVPLLLLDRKTGKTKAQPDLSGM